MSISKDQLKFLRSKCHALRPVILLGQKGLTPAVLKELDIALKQHELLKIRIACDDREQLREIVAALCAQSGAELVQIIGKSPCVYRRNAEKPRIKLPDK